MAFEHEFQSTNFGQLRIFGDLEIYEKWSNYSADLIPHINFALQEFCKGTSEQHSFVDHSRSISV